MSVKRRTSLIVGSVVVILGILVIWRVIGNARAGRSHDQDQSLPVATAVVQVQPMPVSLQSVGQVVSEHTVQIRPQVSGMLKQVYFTEGQTVTAGQPLFLIDPAPFQAALASARAAAENAKANADRLAPLAKEDYATAQEYDDARAASDVAQAAYQQAQINLAYTAIRAPISGRTGSLAVKSGNILAITDANPLVVINQMQPIQVQFSIAQQFLPRVRQFQGQQGIKIGITHEDGSGDLDQGTLVFIDNTINPNTGTVMLKASLPNQAEQLWPGQYVGVNMQLTVEPAAVVVPQSAVQTGQNGNYVYLLKDGKAAQQPIVVDRQVGDLAVISKGLKGGEQVVLLVPRNLRPGMPITTDNNSPAPAAEVALPTAQ
jgi:multidrug efflux system membrane fusion protein